MTTAQAEALAAAREYAESIAEGVIERDRAGTVPARELAALDASGLLGITVPREHGVAQAKAFGSRSTGSITTSATTCSTTSCPRTMDSCRR